MSGPIVILAVGARGDVQPCINLGQGLLLRDHRVRILTSERYARPATAAGLEHFPLSFDFEAVLKSPDWPTWYDGKGPATMMRAGWRDVLPAIETMLAETVAGCAGARATLSPWWASVGYHIGESHGIPSAFLQLQPWEPTRAFPHCELSPNHSLGFGNRASYTLIEQVLWQVLCTRVNRWRTAALGLAPLPRWSSPLRLARRAGLPVLCGFSSHVVPRPRDWGPHVHVTGYWFDPPSAATTPTADLVAFLTAGPPPVYVGFSSYQPGDTGVHRLVVAALRRAGVRGILRGSPAQAGDPGCYGPDMFVVGFAPFEWLLPRCAAVVHHGGAGIMATALRAGVPNVVIPFNVDHPYWGARVAALGAGPKPVPVKGLRPEKLGTAVRQAVTDPAMRAVAAELGRKLRSEDGVARACDVIENWLSTPGRDSGQTASQTARAMP